MNAKLHNGPDAPVVRLRWVYTDQPFLPRGTNNVITNRIWDADQYSDLPVGQLPFEDCDYRQDARWKLPAFAFDGHRCHPEWFSTGEPWPTSLPPTVSLAGWIPSCCVEELMCITDDCAKEPIHALPASQHTQYAVDAVDATPTTPAVQLVVGEGVAGPGPFVPGAELRGLPQGTGGLVQSVVMSEGSITLVARRGAVEAAIGVRVDSLGVPQFVIDNVTVPIASLSGGPLPVAQGGTGVVSIAGFITALGLGTAAFKNTGVSGNTVPLLDQINTWSQHQAWEDSGSFANAPSQVAGWTMNFGGVVAAGFGLSVGYYAKVIGGGTQPLGHFVWEWVNAGAATNLARSRWMVCDHNDSDGREVMRGQANGAAALVGFLGAAAALRQAGDIGTALVTFGLMSGTPTVAGANVAGNIAGNAATATTAGSASVLTPGRTINGVAFDGSADITVFAQSATNTGQTVCAAFTITGATGVYQATGNTIVLPAAGTYLVTGRVVGYLQPGAAGYHTVQCRLRNTTAGADLADSEIVCAGANVSGSFAAGTAAFSAIVTVAGATTLELYAARTGTVWTISNLTSNTDGRSVLDWVRLF